MIIFNENLRLSIIIVTQKFNGRRKYDFTKNS